MEYKPYSPEWHRKRYLQEALYKYFDDYVPTDVIYEDIMEILGEKSDAAYEEYTKVKDLESKLGK